MKVSVIKLYGHKIYCKLKVYESRYKLRAKISTEKLFISSFNSIIQFNFTSFNSEKCLSRKSFFLLKKFLQQFQNSKNFKFSRASPKRCFPNQFVIISNKIMQRKTYILFEKFYGLDQFFILCNNSKTLDVLMMC